MAFMKAQARKARQVGSVLLLGSALFAGGALLIAGPGDETSGDVARTPVSDAEFVSFQPFEAVMCPLPGQAALPYSRSPFMVGQQDENVAPPSPAADPATQVDRAPLHFIKDPYPAWSSIAVNPENDMVVLTDENLHRVVEYGRLDNTPADLEMTEPRRIIGGDQTATEMMCGVYIDPGDARCLRHQQRHGQLAARVRPGGAGERDAGPEAGDPASDVGDCGGRDPAGTVHDDSVPERGGRLLQVGRRGI